VPPLRHVPCVAIPQDSSEDIVAVRDDHGCDIDAFADSTLDGKPPSVYRGLHLNDDDAATLRIVELIGVKSAR